MKEAALTSETSILMMLFVSEEVMLCVAVSVLVLICAWGDVSMDRWICESP